MRFFIRNKNFAIDSPRHANRIKFTMKICAYMHFIELTVTVLYSVRSVAVNG